MIAFGRRPGMRILGIHGPGTITGLGTLRGERVVYVVWDQPRYGTESEDLTWHDTVRACDVVLLSAA
ncbi:hypothetical protein [Nonomuraea angiospora]